MIAYKGFNKDLTCTKGEGVFQYEPGKNYVEEKAKCARTGFHAATNPLDVLNYYNKKDDRYFLVEIEGDVDEDGRDTRISAQSITLKRELTKEQIYLLGVVWITEHPLADWPNIVEKDSGNANGEGSIIVRGKNPKAKGSIGDTLFLLMDDKDGNVSQAGSYKIDGDTYKPGIYYNVKGDEVNEKRRTE